jgi:dTDP-4-dehydrorhamnose reductase
MTILILGKNGQLGTALVQALDGITPIVALDRDGPGDLSKPDALCAYIRELKPKAIINAAAYTAVDRAEDEPEQAFLINGEAPAALALEAKRLDALLIHYSSDYVYAGSGVQAWSESDPTAPSNTYGKSKLAGDDAVLNSGCRHFVFRSSWVFSAHGQNFLKTILRFAQEREELRIVEDQIGAPTSVALMKTLTMKALHMKAPYGVYNLAPAGFVSFYDYGCYIVETARRLGADIKVKTIVPVPSKHYVMKAVRPLNSRLNTTKLTGTFGITLPDWRVDVEKAVSDILK